MSRRLLLVPLSAALATAAAGAPFPEVVGGTPTSGYPEVAALLDAEGDFFCTATLVAPGCLLTAAHCTEGLDAFHSAFFGTEVGDEALAHANLTGELVIHPSWEKSLAHDLAILQLVSKPAIEPVERGERPGSSSSVTVVGFGYDALFVDGIKREAPMPVDSVTADTIVLDGSGGTNSCSGDSGGPIYQPSGETFVQVGVTVAGDPGCTKFAIALPLDIESSWIASTVVSLCTTTREGNGVFFGGFESATLAGWDSPPLATCENRCGEFDEIAFCQCDALCLENVDCCADACDLCGLCA